MRRVIGVLPAPASSMRGLWPLSRIQGGEATPCPLHRYLGVSLTYSPQRRPVAPAGPGQSPSRKPRTASNWITGGVLAVVAFGFTGCSSGNTTPPKTSPVAAAPTAAGGHAAPVTEGSFAFTVIGSKCGVKTVGPADVSQPATGQFCLIDVSVKNVGTQPTVLDSSAQKAIDDQGKQYPVADLATAYLNDQDPNLLEAIKPGSEVKGVLPFHVPPGTKLAAVQLHAAVSTPGVQVPLS